MSITERNTGVLTAILEIVEGRRVLSRTSRWLLCALLVGIGVVLPYLFRNYGALPEGDEGYQYLCVRHYREAPLGMLTFWVGHLWTRLWGDEIVALRCLSMLMQQLAVGVACVYFFRHHGRRWLPTLWLFALCMVACVICNATIYNWDMGAYLYVSMWLYAMLAWWRKSSAWRAAAMGGCAALAMLAHVTFVVYMGVGMAWMEIRGNGRLGRSQTHSDLLGHTRNYGELVWAVGGFAVVWVVGTTVIAGSPWGYLRAFLNPDNIITGHSPGDYGRFLFHFKESAQSIMGLMVPLIYCFFAAWTCGRIRHERGRWWMVAIGSTAVMAYLLFAFKKQLDYDWSAEGLGLPFIWGLILFVPVYNLIRRRKAKVDRRLLWLFGVSVVLLGFGSDYLLNRGNGGLFMVPYVAALIWPAIDGMARAMLRRFMALAMVLLLAIWGCLVLKFLRDYTVPMHGVPCHAGVMALPWQQLLYQKMAADFALLDSAGIRYAAFGHTDNMRILYPFAPEPEMRQINQFHYRDTEPQSQQYLLWLMERYPLVILCHYYGPEEGWTIETLKAHGYTLQQAYWGMNFYARVPLPPFAPWQGGRWKDK